MTWYVLLLLISGAIPIIITIFDLYHVQRSIDVVAHFSSGVFIAGVILPFLNLAWTFVVVTALALVWEWIEPRLQQYVGDLHVGYHDTVGDIFAVISGSFFLVVILSLF
jgi:ABC-type arginine/histidine transport system permease subunit